jgi:hypothetical protein
MNAKFQIGDLLEEEDLNGKKYYYIVLGIEEHIDSRQKQHYYQLMNSTTGCIEDIFCEFIENCDDWEKINPD